MSYNPKPKLKIKRSIPNKRCCELGGPALDSLDSDDFEFLKSTIEFLAKRKEKSSS